MPEGDKTLQEILEEMAADLYRFAGQGYEWEAWRNTMLGNFSPNAGAPYRVRAAMAGVRDMEDKEDILRQYVERLAQSQDIPVPIMIRRYGKNFVYFDPASASLAIVDEEGFSPKDLVDVIPWGAEVAGGFAGVAAGASGSIPGAMAGGGLGAGAARKMAENVLVQGSGFEDPRNIREQAGELALDVGLNPAGEGIGAAAGSLARKGVAKVTGRGVTAPQREAYEAAQRQGIDLSVGQVAGRGPRSWEVAAAESPIGATVMDEFYTRQQREIVNLADAIGESLNPRSSPVDVADAGMAIQRGLQGRINRFDRTREALEVALERQIGGDTWVPINNVMEELARVRQFGEAGDDLARQNYGKVLQFFEPLEKLAAENNGAVPFKELRRLRSNLNKAINFNQEEYLNDQVRRAAQVLKADLEQAALSSGEEGSNIWRALNHYIAQARDEANPANISAITKLVKNGSDVKAYRWALQGTNEGVGKLVELRRALDPEAWQTLSQTVWDQMGRPRGFASDWSGATFLRNWQRMNPSARRLLFQSVDRRVADASVAIDDLLKVVDVTQGTARLRNHSGTARSVIGALLGTAPMKMATGALTHRGAAQAFTNPRFVREVVNGVRILDRSPRSLPAALSRMASTLVDDEMALEWFQQAFGPLISENY